MNGNTTVRGNLIEVALIALGVRQPIYRRQRDNQPFVEGFWGQAYTLEVRNLTGGRLEILNSIDARNTLRDEAASLATNRGMVVNAYDVWHITGWRLDSLSTAKFIFTDPLDSVAQQATGQNPNAGVIGFAAFREFVKPVYRDYGGGGDMRGGPQTLGAAKGILESFGGDMGTGMGSVQSDSVGQTTFQRATQRPEEILTIQYRSRLWLENNGILIPDEPRAYPDDLNPTGYAAYLK